MTVLLFYALLIVPLVLVAIYAFFVKSSKFIKWLLILTTIAFYALMFMH